jgi:hypothetical protein
MLIFSGKLRKPSGPTIAAAGRWANEEFAKAMATITSNAVGRRR